MKLYDLAFADPDVRFSPFCWIAKFGLLHKGIPFETVPLRFTEKENYPDQDHGKLPILADGETIVCDSANILTYLDDKFPAKPLTATPGEQSAAIFANAFVGAHIFPALAPMLMWRVCTGAHADDQAYFRETREKRFGITLEELSKTPGLKEKAEAAMSLLAAPLSEKPFLGGDAPNLSDYYVMSPLMWQRCITSEKLYETPAAVTDWQDRMLDAFDGYGRKAKTAG